MKFQIIVFVIALVYTSSAVDVESIIDDFVTNSINRAGWTIRDRNFVIDLQAFASIVGIGRVNYVFGGHQLVNSTILSTLRRVSDPKVINEVNGNLQLTANYTIGPASLVNYTSTAAILGSSTRHRYTLNGAFDRLNLTITFALNRLNQLEISNKTLSLTNVQVNVDGPRALLRPMRTHIDEIVETISMVAVHRALENNGYSQAANDLKILLANGQLSIKPTAPSRVSRSIVGQPWRQPWSPTGRPWNPFPNQPWPQPTGRPWMPVPPHPRGPLNATARPWFPAVPTFRPWVQPTGRPFWPGK